MPLNKKDDKQQKPQRFCPNCGSTNIDWILPQLWSKWECKNCGYVGALIVEDGKMAEEIKKDYQKKKEQE